MRAWSRADGHGHPRQRPAVAGRNAWVFVVVLLGQVLGGIVGIVEAPAHRDRVAAGVARADDEEDDDRDPLVAWPLLGMVVGGVGGMTTVLVARGVHGVRRRLSTWHANDEQGARR